MSHNERPPSDPVPRTRAEATLSIANWFLDATESRDRSRMEWQEYGVTMLKTGIVFSAIRMSTRLIEAAANTKDIRAVDAYLARALLGGPAIHDPHRFRYYALVPTDSSQLWEVTRDVEPLGLGAYAGVPRPGLNSADDAKGAPYWSVPMETAGALCNPSVIAALVEIGRHELAGQPPAEGAAVTGRERQ